jgi:RNA polymerase sigma-70 factor (ECF subfamily)
MMPATRPSLAALFLGAREGRPEPTDLPALEGQLAALVDRALAGWPELVLDRERFAGRMVGQMAAVLGDDVAAELASFFAEDFALGIACVDQVPGALTVLDRICGPPITAAVARVDHSPELRDEVRQILWQRLFVGTPEQRPRILSYAGRGPLAGWVAVAAQRVALDLRREAARAAASDPGADQVLPSDDHPEIDYLRTKYKAEFEAAVRQALTALPDRDRLLLRLSTVSGLTHEQIATIYKVNQSTVTRWIRNARAEVLRATEQAVCEKLGVQPAEFRSLAGLLLSRIDLSISHVLATSSDS